jgi:hypothetical protein
MTNKQAVLTAMEVMGERPADAARSLRAFDRSASILSSNTPRLIDKYPDEWVAVCDGRVVAHGEKLAEVLLQSDEKGLSREDIVVRFIERTQRTLIL